jgi:hypothetical protein
MLELVRPATPSRPRLLALALLRAYVLLIAGLLLLKLAGVITAWTRDPDAWHHRPIAKAKAQTTDTGPVGKIKWLEDIADHNYDAAEAYLSLKLDTAAARKAIKRLRKAPLTTRRANDILRAAGLTPAPLDDPGVMKYLIKVIEGRRLSPVLVLSGETEADIADGFHRVSLVYRIDPYGEIPLKLAWLTSGRRPRRAWWLLIVPWAWRG